MHNNFEIQIKVPNQTSYLSLIGRIGEIVVWELDCFSESREILAHHLNVVLTEALVNAIKHANAGDPEKYVNISIKISKNELLICVYDKGQGFDLESVHSPCFDKNNLEEAGRGLYIIKTLMDSVVYRNVDDGNVLEIKKTI
ncbi:MAG TPA: ATP-binding protein [Stenomitos sp.]